MFLFWILQHPNNHKISLKQSKFAIKEKINLKICWKIL